MHILGYLAESNHRQIIIGRRTHQLGRYQVIIRHPYQYLIGPGEHMVIGDDMALFVPKKTGTGADMFFLAAPEAMSLSLGAGDDVDYRWSRRFEQFHQMALLIRKHSVSGWSLRRIHLTGNRFIGCGLQSLRLGGHLYISLPDWSQTPDGTHDQYPEQQPSRHL